MIIAAGAGTTLGNVIAVFGRFVRVHGGGDGNQQLVLDPSGNRTTNTWDFENRNTKIKLPVGVINTMSYNADGQRVEKQDSAAITKYVWDRQNYLVETDGSNVTTAVYTNEPAVATL